MKTKVLFAAVAVAFSFAVTSCGNKKAADANAAGADSCCAAQTEQVCDSAKACCQADSAVVRKPVARKLIVRRPLAIAPSVTNLVKRSNSGLVSN